MRLGVNSKIFLAYGMLLLVFAGNAGFTLVTLQRARQRVVENQAYFEALVVVDLAWKQLKEIEPGPTLRPDPKQALAFVNARRELDDGRVVFDRLLRQNRNLSREATFERYRDETSALRDRVAEAGAALGAAQAGIDPAARVDYEQRLISIIRGLDLLRTALRKDGGGVAMHLRATEEEGMLAASLLGAVGLVVAVLVGLVMHRILRPLRVLRERAREVAGGNLSGRTGIHSRDEIGELAQEFDAMAAAIEERERRLIRSERLATVGRMAAQITHEVRNPLASIALYAELMEDEIGSDDGEARRLAGSITSEVDRLTEITETYLRFARLPSPKLEREDPAAIVTSVMEFSRAELVQASIVLEIVIAPELPEIAADENQLRQALINLTRNAREAMAGGGRLRVEVAARDGEVRIAVSDSGPGIAPDDLGKIFEPFFSTKQKGTGLGLALVQQIVVEHGGRVAVDSRQGQGTTFELALPALPPASTVPAP